MRILVTGAARAIGLATAQELAARGHEVVATARDISRLEGVAGLRALRLDVTDDASVRACLAEAGELDAVVNNAALSGHGPLETFPLERLRQVFETNTLGALRLVQALVPAWRERGSGVFVNVSSVQGQVATPLEGPYCASKHALEAVSESLHYELGHFGIRVVIVQPGYIAPGMKATPRHDGPVVYAPLWDQWGSTSTKVTGPGGRSEPQVVAHAIADAIDDPATPLRVRVGADAELVLATRKQLDDAEFERTMRASLDLTW